MNKAFSKRRIVLLISLTVLVLIYIAQLWSSSRTGVKIIRTEGEPSKIVITQGMDTEGEIQVEKSADGNWTLGSKKYIADENSVSSIINAIKEIKILGTAAALSGDGSRYGLDDASKITVEIFDGEKSLRSAVIGKNTSTGNQSYIQLDGKNTILLANKALHSIFDTSEDALRSKKVFSLSPKEISSVMVTGESGTFSVKKESPASSEQTEEDAPLATVWLLEKADNYDGEKISSEKVSAWVNSLSSINAASWADEETSASTSANLAEITITAQGKDYTVQLISEEKISEAETKYLCKSNQSPYLFYIPAYTAGNIKKQLKDLFD